MAALPYMQLYVADYLADTQHLTTEEHGAYMLLIFSYWQTGKPLKVSRLQTLARMFNERWPCVKDSLSEFFTEENGVWIHARIEEDLEKVLSKSSSCSAAGKASALARAIKKQTDSNGRSTGVKADVTTNVSTNSQRKGNHTDTDTDTDTKADTDTVGAKAKRFMPPSLNEAQEYFKERGCMTYSTEAQSFIDFYESKGWMIGKNKMKSWKASVRNWLKNYKAPANNLEGWENSSDDFQQGDVIEGTLL